MGKCVVRRDIVVGLLLDARSAHVGESELVVGRVDSRSGPHSLPPLTGTPLGGPAGSPPPLESASIGTSLVSCSSCTVRSTPWASNTFTRSMTVRAPYWWRLGTGGGARCLREGSEYTPSPDVRAPPYPPWDQLGVVVLVEDSDGGVVNAD